MKFTISRYNGIKNSMDATFKRHASHQLSPVNGWVTMIIKKKEDYSAATCTSLWRPSEFYRFSRQKRKDTPTWPL